MPVPIEFSVSGLYGEFSHHVIFPKGDEFAIIYGPNGVGKTRFFEIIHALSTLNVLDIISLPFNSAEIKYDDETVLSVQSEGEKEDRTWVFSLSSTDALIPVEWKLSEVGDITHSRLGRIFLGGSSWRYVGHNEWIDEEDGERITGQELQVRYGANVLLDELPDEFQSFSVSIETYLIETQRLRNRPLEPRRYRARVGGRLTTVRTNPNRRPPDQENTVSRYAADLRMRLGETLADNSRTTQTLDRTFPRRLLDETVPKEDEVEDSIRARYATQNEKRRRLAELSLIGPEPDLPLQEQELEDWQRRVLRTYLDDTEAKLKTFDDILAKIDLLEDIINKRFIRKRIQVNSDEGMSIKSERTGSRILPEDLSSGEQHELIMFYDLLFRVSPGALVMIDEPEISLHVAWQREFLNDILRVAHVSSARIFVATHSPQIVGKWRRRTTELTFDHVSSSLEEELENE